MKHLNLVILMINFAFFASGCTTSIPPLVNTLLSPSPTASGSTSTVTNTSTSNIRSAKVIFRAGFGTGGSFDQPSATGTTNTVGSGFVPKRIFYPDNTLLASAGPGGLGWPVWLKSFEMGISGSSNTSSPYLYCARFADQNESSDKNCRLTGSSSTSGASNCGVPVGQFRVSEVDCSIGDGASSSTRTQDGNGGPTDGVYIRAQFDRTTTSLGSSENILVNIEYSVSALNPPSINPSLCFNSQTGALSAEQCTDFVWRAYLKNSPQDVTQPFLLFVPPTYSSIIGNANTSNSPASGVGILTKQFVLPLASNPNLTTFQLSRVTSRFPSLSDLKNYCTYSGSTPGNSPFCSGLIIYSMTFFRI